MNLEQKKQLRNLLLDCAYIQDRAKRDRVVEDLPLDIKTSIKRDDVSRVDLANILDTCLNFTTGIDELIEVLNFFEGNSAAMQAVLKFHKELVVNSSSSSDSPSITYSLPTKPNKPNLTAILNLLKTIPYDELQTICFNEPFDPIKHLLSQSSNQVQIASEIIKYSNNFVLIDELLQWLKTKNPRAYQKYAPYYENDILTNSPTNNYPTPDSLKMSIAKILSISPQEIAISNKSDTFIEMQIPAKYVEKLIQMDTTRLKVRQIQIKNRLTTKMESSVIKGENNNHPWQVSLIGKIVQKEPNILRLKIENLSNKKYNHIIVRLTSNHPIELNNDKFEGTLEPLGYLNFDLELYSDEVGMYDIPVKVSSSTSTLKTNLHLTISPPPQVTVEIQLI